MLCYWNVSVIAKPADMVAIQSFYVGLFAFLLVLNLSLLKLELTMLKGMLDIKFRHWWAMLGLY